MPLNTSNTSAGIRKPTGPFTSVAKPAEAAPTRYQKIFTPPGDSSARKPAKMAPQLKKARAMSKITVREFEINSGMLATTIAASRAQRDPYTRRQNAYAMSTNPTPKAAEGMRAAISELPKQAR